MLVHESFQANPKKSEKHSAKRESALLKRGRFWKEIQKNKTIDALMEKYDTTRTGFLNRQVCKSVSHVKDA